jgi:hypothetical protein
MTEDLYPAPIEKKVYERLHETRDLHNDLARRARAYQASDAEYRSKYKILNEKLKRLLEALKG